MYHCRARLVLGMLARLLLLQLRRRNGFWTWTWMSADVRARCSINRGGVKVDPLHSHPTSPNCFITSRSHPDLSHFIFPLLSSSRRDHPNQPANNITTPNETYFTTRLNTLHEFLFLYLCHQPAPDPRSRVDVDDLTNQFRHIPHFFFTFLFLHFFLSTYLDVSYYLLRACACKVVLLAFAIHMREG